MKTIQQVKLFLYTLSIFFLLSSCQFSSSKDLDTKPNDIAEKLTTKENGLECSGIIIYDRDGRIESSQIIYGKQISFQFDDMKGFVEKDSLVFPGLQILVLNKRKDTVMFDEDLYAKATEGIHMNDLVLSTELILARPIQSGSDYDIQTHIWDKKGTGSFDASFKISLLPNESIDIKNNGFSYKEIYLYSDKRGVITDGKVVLDENIHFVIEGLEGYQINNGKASIGGSMEVRNSFGIKLFDEKDLYAKAGELEVETLKDGLSPYVFFNRKDDEGPMKIKCKVEFWDKRSDRSISIKKSLVLVDELDW